MLELVNRERAKAGVQPLAFDRDLNEAAGRHSQWMINTDTFSHVGAGRSQPHDRMVAAGYTFTGAWASGENIAMVSTRAPSGYADEVRLLHNNLMNSAPHRANILSGTYREIGIGFDVGSYKSYTGAFATQNFARTGTKPFITGVAFDDKDGDRFYDPGEGLGGLQVKAVGTTGAVFTTATYGSGGYDLSVPAGTYKVTISGPGIVAAVKTVTVSTKNVKFDVVDPVQVGAGSPVSVKASAAEGIGADEFHPRTADSNAPHGGRGLLKDTHHLAAVGTREFDFGHLKQSSRKGEADNGFDVRRDWAALGLDAPGTGADHGPNHRDHAGGQLMALLEQALSAHTGHRGHKWDQDDDAWAWFGAYFIGTAASSDMIV